MTNTKTTTYADAQIYWDDNTRDGWAYRYTADGQEHSGCVQCTDPDATDEELIAAADELPPECGTVRIFRGTDSVTRPIAD